MPASPCSPEQRVESRRVAGIDLGLHAGVLPLGLADLCAQVELRLAERLDRGMRGVERLQHDVLGYLASARLDHGDGIHRAAHDQVELGLVHLRHQRIDHDLPVDPADADGAHRAEERQRRDRQRGRRTVDGEGVVAVLAVDREHRADDLHLVAEALGPERPDRPVDHARIQRGLLGGLALALEKAAGDLAGGVHLLLDIDGEGEEVGSLTRLAATDGGREHDRGAAAHGDCTVGLAGQLPGREGDLLAADVDRHGGLVQLQFAHSLSCFLKPCRERARRFAAPSRGRSCFLPALPRSAQRRRPSSAISLR